MANPIWITEAGDFGRIAAQEYFDLNLQAYDPDDQGVIVYSLVAGLLPRGLQIDPTGFVSGNPEKTYTLTGVPFTVNQDITSEFTIRATTKYNNQVTGITDRTFKITVTGNYPPVITSLDEPLGTFVDGTEINLQLEALDLNNDPLEWTMTAGKLPPGISMDKKGLISGVIKPINNEISTIIGWDDNIWNNDMWGRSSVSNYITYSFTVNVTDGKSIVTKTFKISVYNFAGLTADTNVITADNTFLTADLNGDRPPVLLTKSLGSSAITNSGGYYAFKFDGIDYDGTNISYILASGNELGFDSTTVGWDDESWDRGDYSLPPGLTLDNTTGWLTGYIPTQIEITKDYTFGVAVLNNESNVASEIRQFTLTILGNLDLAVTWVTPKNLGIIRNGDISNKNVIAKAKSGRQLYYKLKSGSRLPQGLTLLTDGTISGRVSFQIMGFDQGSTTFDKTLASKFVYTRNTNFDNVYSFTVIANDYYNQISSEETFTVSTVQQTYEPYEDIYIRCMPEAEQRQKIFSIIHNTDIFDPEDIYRPLDPYFGLQHDIKFLVSYGVKASKLSQYIEAMGSRHFKKNFFFGEYKLAQGKDENNNLLYDVIYVDLVEQTKSYQNKNGVTLTKSPAPFTDVGMTKPNWRNPRASGTSVIAPNDLTLMQKDISSSLDNSFLNSLPEWMVSTQSNNRILGYKTAAVLAYMKPGTGAKALFNIKKYAPYDIKDVAFVSDRYVLNNSYTRNFDLDKRRFKEQKYTTYDKSGAGDPTIILPVAKVDFAVERPFESIHGKTLEYVINTGGLDGKGYNLQDRYIIFAEQEKYSNWNTNGNDGWNKAEIIPDNWGWDDYYSWDMQIFDKNTIPRTSNVPGYHDQLNLRTLVNQRSGIWQIDIDSENKVRLNFIRSISYGQTYNIKSIARLDNISTVETDYPHNLSVGDVVTVKLGTNPSQSVTVLSIQNALTFSYNEVADNLNKQTISGVLTVPPQYVFVEQGDTHGGTYQLYDDSVIGHNGYSVPKYTQFNSAILRPHLQTTFDKNNTRFVNNIDIYTVPFGGDTYLAFPKKTVFVNATQ